MLVMILKMSAVTAGTILLTFILWKLLKNKKVGWGIRILLGLIFGVLAVLATHFGVDYKDMMIKREAFLQDDTVDTTGAGDTFFGCIIHFVLEHGMNEMTQGMLSEMLTFANAAASIITTRRGALRVMPSLDEITELISEKR